MSTTTGSPDTRRATRPTRGRVVAGVARGLADHLGLPVWLMRVVFVVLALAGGTGLALYAAFWAVLPLDPGADDDAADGDTSRADVTRLLALAAVVVGAVLLLTVSGVVSPGGVLVPAVVAVAGAGLIWQQADDGQRRRWSSSARRAAAQTAGSGTSAGRWRVAAGVGLVLLGLVGILVARTGPVAALQALATALLLLGGLGLVLFPWGYRRWREAQEERRALIRSEERAEVAAQVHDSVLQTLTLIQRHASDPHEVVRLARTEERALRSWLYAPVGDPARTFAARLQADAAQVESAYAATLDVVTVGDAPIDPGLGAMLAAAREAMLNAARHGGGTASVYAEVDADAAEVFVRDRGPGFDPGAVPDDRHGLRDSVVGRMERNGGTAVVRSTPGEGTEVRLRMPRTPEGAP